MSPCGPCGPWAHLYLYVYLVSACCLQHCEAVCTSLKAVDSNKDIAEFVSKASTGTERPGSSLSLLLAAPATSVVGCD